MSVDSIDTQSLKSYVSSQIIEQTSTERVILKLYRYTSSSNSYTNVNLPPILIQELGLEDEVTAETITTSDGRKGILLVKQEGLR